MIQVEQTRTEIDKGNCWQACLASIFELPIEEIPDWNANGEKRWLKQYHDWLAERNLAMLELQESMTNHGVYEFIHSTYNGYYIMGAQSLRFKGLHAVVCSKGEIVWDPHPSRVMGVGDPIDYTFFVVIDPRKSFWTLL